MLLLLGFAGTAAAVPVLWEIDAKVQYINPDDEYGPFLEKSLTGSFVYDADAAYGSRISAVNIAGYDSGSHQLDFYGPEYDPSALQFLLINQEGGVYENNIVLDIFLDGVLTNSGGIVDIVPGALKHFQYLDGSGAWSCSAAYSIEMCRNNAGDDVIGKWQTEIIVDQEFTPSRLIGTVIPVPPAVWLFGSALAGLGWLRRRA